MPNSLLDNQEEQSLHKQEDDRGLDTPRFPENQSYASIRQRSRTWILKSDMRHPRGRFSAIILRFPQKNRSSAIHETDFPEQAKRQAGTSCTWDYGKSPYTAFSLTWRNDMRNPPWRVNVIATPFSSTLTKAFHKTVTFLTKRLLFGISSKKRLLLLRHRQKFFLDSLRKRGDFRIRKLRKRMPAAFGKDAFVLLCEENELRCLSVRHVHNLLHAGTGLFPSHEVGQFWQKFRLQRLLHSPEERLDDLCEVEMAVEVHRVVLHAHGAVRCQIVFH